MNRILPLLLALSLAPSAFAWGEKGHYIVNEAATFGLPADMPPFFHQAYSELVWLAYDPDRTRGGDSHEPFNGPNHFLDYEYVAGLNLSPDRYKYVAEMYRSGRLRQHGIHTSEAGFNPWRVAELAEQLTNSFRLWRASQPGSADREYLERTIINVAGNLGHFIGDAANPHHATMHYNGWAGPNPNNYAIDCGTHGRFESNFVSHAMETSDVVPRLAAPVLREKYFETALEMIKASNALTEQLYRLDRDGAFDYIHPTAGGKEFAADRLAAGASMLRDFWWSAWKNSAQRARRSGGD